MPRWLKYAGLLMLIALIVPLVAACGDDEEASPEAAATQPAPAETTPTTADAATPEASPEATEDATATAPTGAATPDASPAASPPTAASPDTSAMTMVGPFSEDDLNFGREMEEGQPGGVLIEGSFSDISTLNPILISDTASGDFNDAIFESVVTVHPDTLEPVGLLAESWEVNADASVYIFHLREGIEWSDGELLTADDVRFSYEMYMEPATSSPRVSTFTEQIASMEVIDDQTIQFNLTGSFPDFPVQIMVFNIIAEHVWMDVDPASFPQDPGSNGSDPSRVVGTGPFLFSEWIIEDRAVAVPNPNYWRGAPLLDEYIFKVVPDQSAGVAQLRTGEIDYFEGVPEASLQEFEGSQDVTITDYPTTNFTFYGLNLDETKTTLFQDVEVRQALLYALDREAMIDSIRFGFGEVAVGTMPTISWAYAPDMIDVTYDYDPDRAVELLEQAGWELGPDGVRVKDGQRLSFTMYTNAGNQVREAYLTAMQQFWAEIGVEMTPQLEPFPSLVERITSTFDFEAFLVGFSWGVAPDQSTMFTCDAAGGAGFNTTSYCNEEVDALLAEALSEPDQARRIELYAEFQNIVSEELPVTILDFPQGFTGVNNRVHNVFPNDINARFNMHQWWVED